MVEEETGNLNRIEGGLAVVFVGGVVGRGLVVDDVEGVDGVLAGGGVVDDGIGEEGVVVDIVVLVSRVSEKTRMVVVVGVGVGGVEEGEGEKEEEGRNDGA